MVHFLCVGGYKTISDDFNQGWSRHFLHCLGLPSGRFPALHGLRHRPGTSSSGPVQGAQAACLRHPKNGEHSKQWGYSSGSIQHLGLTQEWFSWSWTHGHVMNLKPWDGMGYLIFRQSQKNSRSHIYLGYFGHISWIVEPIGEPIHKNLAGGKSV